MDWFLSVITIAGNFSLGWFKGVWWAWLLATIPAYFWTYYAVSIEQYGLILASTTQMVLYYFTAYRRWKGFEK